MKQRVLEILFKHKFVILLPLLIILPLTIAAAAQPVQPKWISAATVWVDEYRPLFQDDRLGWSPGPSQAGLLNDFLRTRSFAREVISQTRLAPLLDDPVSELEAMRVLGQTIAVYPNSNTMLTIAGTSTDRDLAVELVDAVVIRYQAALQKRSDEQSASALALYQDALTKAEAALTASRQELADYVAANPQIYQRPVDAALPSAARDPNVARLTTKLSNDEATYNAALRRVQDIQERVAAGIQGRPFGFTVLDQPEPGTTPVTPRLVERLKLPLIGLVMGLLLGSGVAVVLVLTNRAVIGPFDVRRQFDLPVLGQLPPLRRRRFWQRRPAHAVRLTLATPARPLHASISAP